MISVCRHICQSLFVAAPTFGAPTLQFGNGASTPSPEKQNRPTIGRSHLPQLGPQALIIRIPFTPTFPRQPIDLLGGGAARFHAVFSLELQIKLHGLLQTLASRLIAAAGSGATAEIGDEEGDEEEGNKAKNVRRRREAEEEEVERDREGR
uniref:Uncharacterized protein MANES_15G022200 n=1 Tax=Rhizophora mucronata TaxID=61149 RepID=A0A2P2MXX8_RHIMU